MRLFRKMFQKSWNGSGYVEADLWIRTKPNFFWIKKLRHLWAIMNDIEHVISMGNTVGEGPIWNSQEQALYWVDIPEGRIFRFFPAERELDTYDLGIQIGCAAFRAAGGLVMATAIGLTFWCPERNNLEVICNPESEKPGMIFNDGSVDRFGRFWVGTKSDDGTASLYRMDQDLSTHRMETGFMVSNGLGWSPDDTKMYLTDSRRRIIYVYDFNLDQGSIHNRRIFAKPPEGEGNPDGLSVDGQGYIWSAFWGGWKIVRFDPDGNIERVVNLPVQYPSSCTFGGATLDELYITSACKLLSSQQRQENPLAGDLFRLKTDIRGQEETLFLG